MNKNKLSHNGIMMNVQDVAIYLRLSEAKIYRMANSGIIPALRLGKNWRFKKDILDEWILREISGRQESRDPVVEPVKTVL
jgi:excisionase family DNA binding protein